MILGREDTMNKRYCYMGIVLAGMGTCRATVQMNHLTKIYQHQGNVSDNVVCYFTQDPICNKLPNKVTELKKLKNDSMVFFMPMTSIHGIEAKNMLKKLHATQRGYSISFQEVISPIKGVKIIIDYDPAKIAFDYQMFDAITGNKGLVFSFHNKEVLTHLKISTDPLLQYACNSQGYGKKPRIMLDIGHGGADEGKVGCFHVREKVINLQIGTKVATVLRKVGCEVFLTRNDDYFVALDDRTTQANKKKVDLFLSIHANAGLSTSACGIETYWLDSKLLKKKSVSCDNSLQKLTTFHDTSCYSLAQNVHEYTLSSAKKIYNVNDRKVKASVTQVLLGTDLIIPSALIEVGFLSNQQETKMLIDNKYQMALAEGISNGIMQYFHQHGF